MPRENSHYSLTVGSCYHDDRYKVLKQISVGSTSSVWVVEDLRADGFVARAIKVLDSDYQESYELEILRRLSTHDRGHPGYEYVLKLHDSFEIFEGNNKHICLVVDLVGHTLQYFLHEKVRAKQDPVLSLQVAKLYLKQLLLALQYAHAAGVIHTDIKSDNILVRLDHSAVCLCDWGEAVWTSKISTRVTVQPLCLRAPEVVISARPVWDSSIDIWNFGALILEFVENIRLFNCLDKTGQYDTEEHLQEIVNLFGDIPQSLLDQGEPQMEHNLSLHSNGRKNLDDWLEFNRGTEGEALKQFMMEVMVIDPAKRPTAEQLVDNMWFKQT